MKKIIFRTITEFKREAIEGRFIKGGYYEKQNNDEWREIIATQTNAIILKTDNKSGRSYLDFPKASKSEIKDGTLYIYEDRVKCEEAGIDTVAETSWLKWEIEQGKLKEEELIRYRNLVAKYELGEQE